MEHQMRKPPRWIKGKAVTRFVEELLEEAELEAEREHYMRRWDTHPGIPLSELCTIIERDAVEATQRGQPDELCDLVRSNHPMNIHLRPPLRSRLTPNTFDLLADIASGNHKRRVGRPKMADDERRMMNPIHDAAELVPQIEYILHEHFLSQSGVDIWDKATEIAAKRHGVKNVETLRNHLRRSHSDRRRLPSHARRRT
jgi:hypothetical protein